MFCPKCGLQLPEGTNFCPRCGTPLNTQYTRQPQQVPQNPIPVQQPQKKKKPFWKTCLIMILAAVVVFIILLIAVGSGGRNSGGSKPTRTPVPTRTPTNTPNPTGTPTITPTAQAEIPDYCGDAMQLELIRLATILNTDEHPHPEEFDPNNNVCLYSLRNTHSFLLTENYGYITFLFAEDNYLFGAVMNLDYIDSAEFMERVTDWGAVLYSYIDKSKDPLTAYAAVKLAESNGIYSSGNFSLSAELQRNTMKYRIAILDMTRIEIEE